MNTVIHSADDREKELAARLLSETEPWITLRISYEQCHRNCFDPEFQVYIAYTDGIPSGIILIDPRGLAGSPYIKSVAAFPEFRGKGVGKLLLEHAEMLFRGKAKYLFLCVSTFNKRAQKFYLENGFTPVGELKDYIIEGAGEILMHKRLL